MRMYSPAQCLGHAIYPLFRIYPSLRGYPVDGHTLARLQKAAYLATLRRVSSLRYRARPFRLLWNPKVMKNEVDCVSSCERGTGISLVSSLRSYAGSSSLRLGILAKSLIP